MARQSIRNHRKALEALTASSRGPLPTPRRPPDYPAVPQTHTAVLSEGMADTARCTGPATRGRCQNDVYAKALCRGHYAQHARGRELAPLRDPVDEAREVVSIRVSPACREAVRADPDGARATLERWAAPRRAKRRS